jgi:NAD(P)-dependent dehydrogenase (short-subunit alcohol dehydrogenase family)
MVIAHLPAERSDAEETRRAVESHGRKCALAEGDLVEASFCDDLVESTVQGFGKLDILVSNAALQNRKKSLDEVTDAEFDETFKTNVCAYFRLARAALRHMKAGGSINLLHYRHRTAATRRRNRRRLIASERARRADHNLI